MFWRPGQWQVIVAVHCRLLHPCYRILVKYGVLTSFWLQTLVNYVPLRIRGIECMRIYAGLAPHGGQGFVKYVGPATNGGQNMENRL